MWPAGQERSFSSSTLCSPESSHGVLCPALASTVEERHGPIGAGPEEGHKNNQRDGTPLLRRKAERVGIIQPREEKSPGSPYCGFSVLKVGL